MYKNVVSTQELLSDSQRTNYSSDSALFSLSQKQQSQSDFSQVKTQDLFTQNQSETQSESSFPATKKLTMYDKWTSKGGLFKKDLQSQARSSGSSLFSHQPAQNKNCDSDDRELLQKVVSIVQDCNKEVKCTLTAVKEKLESQCDSSTEKLCDTMKAFLEDIWKHEERMFKAVTDRSPNKEAQNLQQQLAETLNESNAKMHELEKQLAVKEAELKQFQNQLSEGTNTCQLGDLKKVAKAVREELLSPQLSMENKILEILEVTKEASEQQNKQLDQCYTQMTTQNKRHSEWKSCQQKLVKDMEKRVTEAIKNLKKDLQKQELEWKSILRNQLSEATADNLQYMENLIQKVLSETMHTKTGDFTMIVAGIKKDVQKALQAQSKSTEKSLHDLLSCQLQSQNQQLKNLCKMLLGNVSSEAEQTLSQQNKGNFSRMLPAPQFDENFQEYHADIKHTLEEMSKKHVEEVKQIKRELKLYNSSSDKRFPMQEKESVTSHTSLLTDIVKPEQVHANICWKKDHHLENRNNLSRIFSPLTSQERASLFQKNQQCCFRNADSELPISIKTADTKQSNHSLDSDSVVFGSPKFHRSNGNHFDDHLLTQSFSSDSSDEVIFGMSKTANISAKEILTFRSVSVKENVGKVAKRKNMKRVCKGRKKRKSSRKKRDAIHIPSSHQQQVSEGKKPVQTESRNKEQAEETMAFDFSYHSPETCWWQTERSMVEKKNILQSPLVSVMSNVSSPAVSVTIDKETVLLHRSRWQTSVTPKRLVNEAFIHSPSPQMATAQRHSRRKKRITCI